MNLVYTIVDLSNKVANYQSLKFKLKKIALYLAFISYLRYHLIFLKLKHKYKMLFSTFSVDYLQG